MDKISLEYTINTTTVIETKGGSMYSSLRTAILLVAIATVSGKTVFKLKLLKYEAKEDTCCDGVSFFATCNECDPYFQVCLKERGTGQESCQETSRENDKRLVDLTSSNISPTTFTLPLNSLLRNVTINIKTMDYDAVGGNDEMDSLRYTFTGLSLFNSESVMMNGSNSKYSTRITVEGIITCDQYYFGPSCDVYCKNGSGVFCDSYGNKTDIPLLDAINVNCDEFGWDIGVDIDLLRAKYTDIKTSDIFLGKELCNGYEDGSMLRFKQGLRECRTSETRRLWRVCTFAQAHLSLRHSTEISCACSNGDLCTGIKNSECCGEAAPAIMAHLDNQLIYKNELLHAIRDTSHQFIIRRYDWVVQVECDINRNETAAGHIVHDGARNHSLHLAQQSHYAVSMKYYSDSNFMNEIQGNPLQVRVGSDVYVKVFTTASNGTVKMVLQNCYTQSSFKLANESKYYLIHDGCEEDVNTRIISQNYQEVKFSFQDFQYTSSQAGLYLFCDAVFCGLSDSSLQCQQRCRSTGKRSAGTLEDLELVTVTDRIIHST